MGEGFGIAQAGPLMIALRQHLRADTALMAVVKRVEDHMPDGSAFPYVMVPEAQSLPDGGQCFDGGEHFIDLHVWTRSAKRGSKQCFEILGLILAALDGVVLDLGPNVALGLLVPQQQRVFREPDHVTWHGVLSLRALTQEVT